MSLAIADCLVAILVMPMGMIAEVLGHFPLPHYACIIFATMDVLCCTSSIWHMSTMSMDRYFTIRFPFRYGRNKTRRIMLWKITAVWAISTAISSPVFVLGLIKKENVLSNGVCAPNNAAFKIYGSIFAFYIPFVIMITTYALTMRSLRNVLVNKKKYNRERRRKQTFRPLAQIIHQYAEIAQGIRRSSTTNQRAVPVIASINPNNPNPSTSLLNKTPYTIITTTSPTDSRAQFFSSNNPGSLNTSTDQSESNPTGDGLHHNCQHLTISYNKSSGSKKQRRPQQNSNLNTTNNRPMNECDMSTVYEITEYSKSTSSSHEVTTIFSGGGIRRSLVINEQQSTAVKATDTYETRVTSAIINDVSPVVEEEEASLNSEIDSPGKRIVEESFSSRESVCLAELSSAVLIESIFVTIPWRLCFFLVDFVVRYYLRIFPYRLRALPIDYHSYWSEHARKSQVDRSTSTSSISRKGHRTVSTQTHLPLSIDFSTMPPADPKDHHVYSTPKRRRFPFHRPVLTSPSLFTNLFRHASGTPVRSSESSTKSSFSWGQRSSVASSSNAMRQKHSSNLFRRIESEMDTLLATDRRSHASTSSSSVLHTTHRPAHPSLTHWQKPLRRHQYQSRSAYVINHPGPTTARQQFSSTTNSSDSSSVHPRHYARLLATIPHHHRARDEDIVAANERKALRVLMIIFCVFITLWTPFFICTFISAICERCRDRLNPTVWFSITWLGYSSSMANPFIYTIFSDVFRRAFTNIILCRPNDSLLSGQLSTKLTHPKGGAQQAMHQHASRRRSPNHDQSGTSTPNPLLHPTPLGGSDATIYVNRCASDSFR